MTTRAAGVVPAASPDVDIMLDEAAAAALSERGQLRPVVR